MKRLSGKNRTNENVRQAGLFGYLLQNYNYFCFNINEVYCTHQYFLELESEFQAFKIRYVFMLLNVTIIQN